MPGSIRGRLTAALAALIVLCIGTYALAMYLAVGSVVSDDLNHTLRMQAEQIAATSDFVVPEFSGPVAAQPGELGVVDQVAKAGIIVETFDMHGHITERSDYLHPGLLATAAEARALAREAPHFYAQPVPGGLLRVYSLPATLQKHRVGVVLVAAALRQASATTQAVLVLLVVVGVVVALVTLMVSGLLVKRGLRPLDDMARVAESINARRLDQRPLLHDPPREVARLARTFGAMLDRLHEAFALQHRFVGDASHELRTPLSIIRGRSEVLLLNPALDSATREGLTMIRDEAGRMGRLVANLLLLARGDEGAIDRRPVELDALLLEVAQHAHSLAQDLTVTIGHEDQALVCGDADLLKQLALNLVDNALAYTPAGGCVELSLAVADGWARLSVRDTGAGIAPDDLEHIFERFYRPDRARSRHQGGAGLGLAIVRWIADAHGGRVEVQSIVGQGSTFTLILPLYNHPLTSS